MDKTKNKFELSTKILKMEFQYLDEPEECYFVPYMFFGKIIRKISKEELNTWPEGFLSGTHRGIFATRIYELCELHGIINILDKKEPIRVTIG